MTVMKFNAFKFAKLLNNADKSCTTDDLAMAEYIWANHPSIIGTPDEKMKQIAGLYIDFGSRMMRHLVIGSIKARGMRIDIEFSNQQINKHKKKATYTPKLNECALIVAHMEVNIETKQEMIKELKEKEDEYIGKKQLLKLRSLSVRGRGGKTGGKAE